MKEMVELDAFYPHPPERVWKAMTDSEALSRWLMPTDFKPLIGFRFRFDRPSGSKVEGKVVEVEPGQRLEFTWRDDEEGQPSIVVWTLEPKDGGTRLCIQHLPLEEPQVNCLVIDNHFNWLYALKHSLPGLLCLLQHLDTGRPPVPIVYVSEPVKEEVKA